MVRLQISYQGVRFLTFLLEAANPNGVADEETNDKIQKQNISLASDFWIRGIYADME